MNPLPTGKDTMSSELPSAVNYHNWLTRLMTPWLRGVTLEVGAGYGQYSEAIAKRATQSVIVDCDAETIARLPILSPGVEKMIANLADPAFADRVGRSRYDTMICLNVLEHIEEDEAALAQMKCALKSGGKLLLFVPAHAALYGQMDSLAGHFRRYNRSLLREKLTKIGLRVVEMRYFNPVGGLGWWFQAKFGHTSSLSAEGINAKILFFDRYLQPISEVLDPFTRKFFGQSLWVVAERPPSST